MVVIAPPVQGTCCGIFGELVSACTPTEPVRPSQRVWPSLAVARDVQDHAVNTSIHLARWTSTPRVLLEVWSCDSSWQGAASQPLELLATFFAWLCVEVDRTERRVMLEVSQLHLKKIQVEDDETDRRRPQSSFSHEFEANTSRSQAQRQNDGKNNMLNTSQMTI